jgi:hypothetical protein
MTRLLFAFVLTLTLATGAALVSHGAMRGSSGYGNGGVQAARYATPERLAIPLLYMVRRGRPVQDIPRTTSPANHMDFPSWALRRVGDAAVAAYRRAEAALANSWVARYLQELLDAWLQAVQAARR